MDGFNQFAAPGYPIFLGSEFPHPRPEDAFFHVLPVPFEASVTYGGGTGAGPAAILAASWQLETWDGQSTPCEKGIYTHAPVAVDGEPSAVVARIACATRGIVAGGHFPVAIGGEHTLTYGMVKGLMDANARDVGVVQIDAHADLRMAYEDNPYSHASVMRRIVEMGIPLYQVGVRALCSEEIAARTTFGVHHVDADILVPGNLRRIDLPGGFPDQVFLTLDIDGLDPSIFPSTGTPVPGGVGWYQTLSIVESIARQREIVGFDVVEFAPIPAFHAYEFAAALLIYKLMGIVERGGEKEADPNLPGPSPRISD